MTLTPYDILKYESCPRQYHLMKTHKKGKKQQFAFYRFSSALHYAVKQMTTEHINPKLVFTEYWKRYQTSPYPLVYKSGESWEFLYQQGLHLLTEFEKEFESKNISPILAENKMTTIIHDVTFIVQPDLIGEQPGYFVLDYKTSEYAIKPIWTMTSDQLTAGAMIAMEMFQVDEIDVQICNFVKENWTVQWFYSKRNMEDIEAYRQKILFTAKQIDHGYFPRRSLNPYDSPCVWCEVDEMCFSKQTEDDFLGLQDIEL